MIAMKIELVTSGSWPEFRLTHERFAAVLPACICVTYPGECNIRHVYPKAGERFPRQWTLPMAEEFAAIVLATYGRKANEGPGITPRTTCGINRHSDYWRRSMPDKWVSA